MAGDPLELLIEARQRALLLVGELRRKLLYAREADSSAQIKADLDDTHALIADLEKQIRETTKRRTVSEILLTLRAQEGDSLAMVKFTDGGFGITRNGIPLDVHYSSDIAAGLDACLSEIQRLAGIDRSSD